MDERRGATSSLTGSRSRAVPLKRVDDGFAIAIVVALVTGLRRRNPGAVVNGFLSLALSRAPGYLERAYGVRLRPWQRLWISAAALVHVVGMLGPYDRTGWWDEIAHTLSASVVAGTADVLFRARAKRADESVRSTARRSGSADESEVDGTSVERPPVDGTSVERPPVDRSPVDRSPVDRPPVDRPPVDRPPVDDRTRVTLVVGVTLGLGVFWEVLEYLVHWVAERAGFEPLLVHYGRRDTVTDVAANALGAALVVVVGRRALANIVDSLGDE